jgi:hypothetical protein
MSLPNYVKFSKQETVVVLAEDRGTLKTNTYGEYFLRKFTDGRFCCAAPELERKLVDAGIRAGATVGITCEKYGQSHIWKVRIVAPAPGPQAVQHKTWPNHPVRRELPPEKYASLPSAQPPLEEQLKQSIAHVEAQKKPVASEGIAPLNSSMAGCFISAIDALITAKDYAQSKGIDLRLHLEITGAELQDLATSLYIGMSKQANINLMNRNEALRAQNGAGARLH